MAEHSYFVYMLTNCSRHPLYTGVTSRLLARHDQHKQKRPWDNAYTAQYNLTRLVYYERFQFVQNAIAREKQLKRWSRKKKIALIERMNPKWDDLSREFGRPIGTFSSASNTQGPSTSRPEGRSARDDNSFKG